MERPIEPKSLIYATYYISQLDIYIDQLEEDNLVYKLNAEHSEAQIESLEAENKELKDEQVKKALEEVEKSLPSDEEIKESIEAFNFDYVQDAVIEGKSMIRLYRNKTQEVINKINNKL